MTFKGPTCCVDEKEIHSYSRVYLNSLKPRLYILCWWDVLQWGVSIGHFQCEHPEGPDDEEPEGA